MTSSQMKDQPAAVRTVRDPSPSPSIRVANGRLASRITRQNHRASGIEARWRRIRRDCIGVIVRRTSRPVTASRDAKYSSRKSSRNSS